MFPVVAFIILGIIVVVVIVATVVGGIGTISRGPNPDQGDKHVS